MKIIRFLDGADVRVGVMDDGIVVDPLRVDTAARELLLAEYKSLLNVRSLIESGKTGTRLLEWAVRRSRELQTGRVARSEVRLLAPLDPEIILCGGGNYRDHVEEKAEAPLKAKEPEFFLKAPGCVIGPEEGIVWDRRVTQKLDYECELGIIIGKTGRHIPRENALDHVYGYTIVNDVTARDRQVRMRDDGTSWYETGPGKNFDTSAPMGPWIVTADEVGDPQSLVLQTRVNDELRQSNTTRNMIFGVAELVHFFSTNLTLRPGYVIITGTPGGTAWATDPDLGGKAPERGDVVKASGYLKAGDTVFCEIERIGVLQNRIIG